MEENGMSLINISIHASAKEATDFEYFVGDAIEFQSTPPRRRRRLLLYPFSACHSHFNPRLREGGDNIGINPDTLYT